MINYNSFFGSNRAYLQAAGISSRILAWCSDELPQSVSIYKTKTNELSIKYRETLLHSLYDPQREAERFIDLQQVREGDHVLVYGLGLGYHIRVLRDRVGTQGKIVVFEPNTDIVTAALTLIDLRTLIVPEQVKLIVGDDEELLSMNLASYIDREFRLIPDERKKVIIHLPSYQSLPPSYTAIQEVFDLLLLERRASEVFAGVEKENCRNNIDILLRSPSLEGLKKTFSGKPAFFVNAGPSLDGALPYLAGCNDKAFVFTSDTSYGFLQQAGIAVDVIFSVDPQTDTAKHFDMADDDRALLIALPTMDAGSLKNYRGPKMCILQKNNTVTKNCETLLQNKTFTYAGSSVSCIGLDVIVQLGCNPIIFVGMDYAFPAYKFYSTNTAETKKWYTAVTRFHTVEMLHLDVIREQKIKMVPGCTGIQIPTHQTLYVYLRQIEDLIVRYPEVTFYNFMSHGSVITGAEHLARPGDLSDVLKRDCDKKYESFLFEEYTSEFKEQVLARLA